MSAFNIIIQTALALWLCWEAFKESERADYFEKLSKTLKGNENLNLIAQEGHKVGATYLNYKSYAHQLKTFLHNL